MKKGKGLMIALWIVVAVIFLDMVVTVALGFMIEGYCKKNIEFPNAVWYVLCVCAIVFISGMMAFFNIGDMIQGLPPGGYY